MEMTSKLLSFCDNKSTRTHPPPKKKRPKTRSSHKLREREREANEKKTLAKLLQFMTKP